MQRMHRLIQPPAQSPDNDELMRLLRALFQLGKASDVLAEVRGVLVWVSGDRDALDDGRA